MINIVIDTNVIVSALISPHGKPAKIKAIISDTEDIQVFYSTMILNEYRRVLAYERLNISRKVQNNILDMLQEFGILVEPTTSIVPLIDETDRAFYDVAKTSNAILITGNIKHYPAETSIMTPSDFLARLGIY